MKRMRAALALSVACLWIWPLEAQFPEVVSTDDGLHVYFTTQAILKTMPRPNRALPELRAYRIAGAGVELFAERGPLARPDSGSSSDGVTGLQVSGDGASVAYTLYQICALNEPCTRTIERAEVRGRYAQILGEGAVRMSRNGEWAILNPPPFGVPSEPGLPPVRPTEATLINLRTGQRSAIPLPATRGNPLTSDGTVLVNRPNEGGPGFTPGLLKGSNFQPLSRLSGAFNLLAVSDDGRKLFFTQIDLPAPGQPPPAMPPIRLMVRDLTTNTDLLLHTTGAGELIDLLGVGNDGRRALALLWRPAAGARQLTGRALVLSTDAVRAVELMLPPTEGAASGTISGHGNAAFLFTGAGRLLRFNLDPAGNVAGTQELLPPSPYICCADLRVSPGEVIKLNISAPGVTDWSGRIQLQNLPLPVLASDATGPTVQIPWETLIGQSDIVLDTPLDSPFAPRQTAFISPAQPRFVPAEQGSNSLFTGVKIILGDFSGYLTRQPQPGEILHLYLTGLGPVRGSVQTGQPAPVNDLRPIQGNITCRFMPHLADAETLFAGLAPGLLGYYQVTLRMPAQTSAAPVNGLRCEFQTSGFGTTLSIINLPQPAP